MMPQFKGRVESGGIHEDKLSFLSTSAAGEIKKFFIIYLSNISILEII